MKNISFFIILFLLFSLTEILNAQHFKMDLYPAGKIPNSKTSDEKEIRDSVDVIRYYKVQIPDISVFLPARRHAREEAVIICPGGGYTALAYNWEGEDIAKFWNSKGIAGIVLKYRLPSPLSQPEAHKTPLLDAQRALRLVRYHAQEWNINPDKIAIMGFSAGGHLASALSTHFDNGNPLSEDPVERMSCRPDFSILVYPVISFTSYAQHTGSRKAIAGDNEELMRYYSSELQVKHDTPPAILIHSADDKVVPVENSISYFKALHDNKIPAEMHIYPYGGHGYSLAIGRGYLSSWPERCYDWLISRTSEK